MNTFLKPIKTLSMLKRLMKEFVLHEGILNKATVGPQFITEWTH